MPPADFTDNTGHARYEGEIPVPTAAFAVGCLSTLILIQLNVRLAWVELMPTLQPCGPRAHSRSHVRSRTVSSITFRRFTPNFTG